MFRPLPLFCLASCRQRSLQYLTSSQQAAHFLRQLNGRPHRAQSFEGRCVFFFSRGIVFLPNAKCQKRFYRQIFLIFAPMKCLRCKTELPSGARFCFHCGAPQAAGPEPEREPEPKPMADLDGDVPRQLTELFFQALRRRVEAEHRPEQFQAYSERLYESGFRDTVYRRAGQLGEELRRRRDEGQASPRQANRRIKDLFEELLDYFIIHHCRDINDIALPEAILRWQGDGREDANFFQMALDYLGLVGEPDEKVYTDFLKMPVEKLKNAGKFFLFPERDERIWLICDQSLFGSCKEGFALTERALYWKAQLQTARKVSYRELREARREKDWLLINGHFFHASPSLDLKLMKLLKKLRRLYR